MVERPEMNAEESELPETPVSPVDEIAGLRAKLDEALRAYSRLQQERDDFRRRADRERERVLEAERGKVALTLAETVDQLELILNSASEDPAGEGLAAGVRLIRDGLLRQLEQGGLSRQVTEGEAFVPSLHEAVETVPVSDPRLDGKILSETRAGYLRGDRLLRPARVSVGKLSPGGKS